MAEIKEKKKKPPGHCCRVCGIYRANKKFSGTGHMSYICDKCLELPIAERNERMTIRKIKNMASRTLSNVDLKWLRGRTDDSRPDVRNAARKMYNRKYQRHESDPAKSTEIKKPVFYSALNDEMKGITTERLRTMVDEFFLSAGYIPNNEDRTKIFSLLCNNMSGALNQEAVVKENDAYAEPEKPRPKTSRVLVPDDGLKAVFDGLVADAAAKLKEEGVELPAFIDTLMVAVTERLTIRRFYKTDLDALWEIMNKLEVLSAREFKKSETRKWLNRQYARYQKDGYGYFAVLLKDSGKMIGQAGLLKQDINGEAVVEIGYIFDDRVWRQGYAFEAARACMDLAFHRFGIDRLYATVRPENAASVRLLVKLGMRKTGEFVKTNKGKEILHDIYVLERKLYQC